MHVEDVNLAYDVFLFQFTELYYKHCLTACKKHLKKKNILYNNVLLMTTKTSETNYKQYIYLHHKKTGIGTL